MRSCWLAAPALAFAVLAGCGSDDESTPPAAKPPTKPGATLRVVAPNTGGGSFRYSEERLEAPAGSVELVLINEDVHQHDVKLQTGVKCCYEAGADDVGGTDVITKGKTSAVVELEAGEYVFFCSIPGHAEDGMQGRLSVS